MADDKKTLLWWGRSNTDYSRNRIIRQLFTELGWQIIDFSPRISRLADLEALITKVPVVDLIWVPCFRQRDMKAARRWADRTNTPLIFDPLISAFDKQVWEKKKYKPESRKAKKLLAWEQTLMLAADYVVADTVKHALFFTKTFELNDEKVLVLPVSAEEQLFTPEITEPNKTLKILFYGSFINLQGPEIIAEAIRQYDGRSVHWLFVGDGPLKQVVYEKLKAYPYVEFRSWMDYEQLPEIIASADVCLGIFGETEKTQRVIPNKVYQALACGRPVITCASDVYPEQLSLTESGLFFVPANNAQALADSVKRLANNPERVFAARTYAANSYATYFSNTVVKAALTALLKKLNF